MNSDADTNDLYSESLVGSKLSFSDDGQLLHLERHWDGSGVRSFVFRVLAPTCERISFQTRALFNAPNYYSHVQLLEASNSLGVLTTGRRVTHYKWGNGHYTTSPVLQAPGPDLHTFFSSCVGDIHMHKMSAREEYHLVGAVQCEQEDCFWNDVPYHLLEYIWVDNEMGRSTKRTFRMPGKQSQKQYTKS